MIDLGQFRQASFRGVPFHVSKASRRSSHRVDKKGYPFQSKNLVRDMGLDSASFELRVYLLGDDVLQRRQDLETAFDKIGPGILIHPTRGELLVQIENVRDDEDMTELAVADYVVTCCLAGDQVGPVAVVDSQAAVITASKAVEDSAPASIVLEAINEPAVQVEAENDLAMMTDRLNNASAAMNAASPHTLLNGLQAVQDARKKVQGYTNLATAAFGFVSTAFRVANQWYSLATDPNAAMRFLLSALGVGGIYALLHSGFSGVGSYRIQARNKAWSAGRIPASSAVAANRVSLVNVVNVALVTAAAKQSSKVSFSTLPEALQARDLIAAKLADAVLTPPAPTVAPEANAAYRASLRNLKTAVYRDITARSAQLPSLQSFTPASVQPSRVLAWRLSKGLDSDLASRNGARHPSFMPAGDPLFYRKGGGNA